MNFTEVIKKKIENENISVRELARRMNRSHVYVNDLIAENRRWNEDTINEACQALGIEIRFINSLVSKVKAK
ncbi:MAG TPA: helix-turn-helix transcriptional regulator [Selenomonadales bacterium]|nr:helix-turn-helix transcriptional regulator [Selenomonadales bacterium]